MLKGKSISSEKSQFLEDESSRLRGGSSKKGSDISETKSISDTLGKEITLELKAYVISPWNCVV